MERILVVVFDNEKKAYEGKSALRQLEREGSTCTHAGVVVFKDVDGTVSVKPFGDDVPIGSLTLTAVGSLIGLLGGPAGLAVGGLAGLTFGAFCDIDAARVGEDVVGDVSRSLAPDTAAVVAEIDEEWTTPVDTLMEALGGVVFRRALWEVREKIHDGDIGAMKADFAQRESETVKAHPDRKAKLQENLDLLGARIEAQHKKTTERRDAFPARQKAKGTALRKNAASAGRPLLEGARTRV